MVDQGTQVPLDGLLRLDGQVAIVTGGARGIGRGIVDRFAEAGASVVLTDKSGAAEAASEVEKAGAKVVAVEADLSRTDAAQQIVDAGVQAFGKVDVLVNNAGIYPFKPALDMTAEEWDLVQHVNLRGLFLVSQAFARLVRQRGTPGSIVNIGSIDSIHPSAVGLAAYDASKGGVLMFTKNFAREVAPLDIRVNMIAPGGITTEGTSAGMTGLSPEQASGMMSQFTARIPMGRMGTPDEIATMTLVLASPAAAYMTGSVVVVDGGMLLA